MAFLEWMHSPENAEELREIKRTLRCSDAEAVLILQLADLTTVVDALGTEVACLSRDGPEDEEEEQGA